MGRAEQVVLLDAAGRACGVADKANVHSAVTPYHLAFSSYVFNPEGMFLSTRRALHKATWPGFWTNSCCGHPAPGEALEDAVRRRLRSELGLRASSVRPALPDFSYRAEFAGIVEHEFCPVFLVRVDAEPRPDPDEVAEYRWEPWEAFVCAARDPCSTISPWAQAQVHRLQTEGHVPRFLAQEGN